MAKSQKKSSLWRGALSISWFSLALFLAGCGFTPIYDKGEPRLAPDLLRGVEITGEGAETLRALLDARLVRDDAGRYDLHIHVQRKNFNENISRENRAARKRIRLTATIKARLVREPHFTLTRQRQAEASFNDRQDALANLTGGEARTQALNEQLAEQIYHFLISLSERERAQ